ncbi:unnamed protein product [Choristocarpus tenellus]
MEGVCVSSNTGLVQVNGGNGTSGQVEYDMEDLYPPDNFAMVDVGIYRSSFPMKKHFPFLSKLGLRTILTLVIEDLPHANYEFIRANGIKLIQIGVEGNKVNIFSPKQGPPSFLAKHLRLRLFLLPTYPI